MGNLGIFFLIFYNIPHFVFSFCCFLNFKFSAFQTNLEIFKNYYKIIINNIEIITVKTEDLE